MWKRARCPLGGCDVAVCDGFTGNIILKTTEGLAKLFMSEIKGIFMKSLPNKLAAAVVKKDLGAFKRKLIPPNTAGPCCWAPRSRSLRRMAAAMPRLLQCHTAGHQLL